MQILQKVSLKRHSTMRLGGMAAYSADITNRQDLIEAVKWAKAKRLTTIMIGDGSNIVWKDECYNGLLLVNKIKTFELFKKDTADQYLIAGAGENWDSVVERAVKAGVTGIEALSLIPGTVGATPVQNVGAYGQEISQTLGSVEVFDTKTGKFKSIPNEDCDFGYRTSRFKTHDHGRFFITGITLHLRKGSMKPPFYPSLEKYLVERHIKDYSPASIRQAVINIRNGKLPDPKFIANNGSFFANPIVGGDKATGLIKKFPDIPHWPAPAAKIKISAAWLVENAGFKDYHDKVTGMATWYAQSLVLVNEHAKTTAELLKFKQKIVKAVEQKFDVTLEQEPELLP